MAAFACLGGFCKRLACLVGNLECLARSTLDVVGAPSALAEVEPVHYCKSLPYSIRGASWCFQSIDSWTHLLVAAQSATPVVFLDPYGVYPIFAKKVFSKTVSDGYCV